MAPADCVQKSALIIQLRFLLFMSGRVRAEHSERALRPNVDSTTAALKEQTAVHSVIQPSTHTSDFIQKR